MASCKFIYNEDKHLWICEICGRTVNAPKENIVLAKCSGPIKEPSFSQKAVNYVKAIATHITTGAATRTDEEVENRLKICQSCTNYNSKDKYCRICGCRCNANKSAFTNKLRMKSQHCPIGKWS